MANARSISPTHRADPAGLGRTAVDTGWINDEKPAAQAAADARTHNFQTPIDEIDAAARVLDPIIAPLLRLEAGQPAAPEVRQQAGRLNPPPHLA